MAHRTDWQDPLSLHNWVQQYSLECVSNRRIGMIGSMHFIGWVLLLPVVPALADKYGRKWITCTGVVLQVLATFGILFSS